MFILEISAGIAALAFQSQIRATIANNINSTMYESADNEKAAETIDFIQKEVGLSPIAQRKLRGQLWQRAFPKKCSILK